MMHDQNQCGRVKTALVFGAGREATAVLTWGVVRADAPNSENRIQFSGPVAFAPSAQSHLREVVILMVDRILRALGLPLTGFEISIANVGATSCHDLGIQVDGFSADASVFIAAFSASLGMPVPPDVLITGHVASPGGDIAAVRALPAKLAAAAADPTVRRFFYPRFDRDASLPLLSPHESAAMESALVEADARSQPRTFAVRDVAELITRVFAEEDIVLASVTAGFFGAAASQTPTSNPLARAVQHLTDRLEDRFWLVLEDQFQSGRGAKAVRLLQARASLHIQRREYPRDFGRKLLQLLQSLPPPTRRLGTTFPLLTVGQCIELSQFAGEADHADVQFLFDAAAGKIAGWSQPRVQATPITGTQEKGESPTGLDLVLAAINAEALAQRIGLPIDTARATYQLGAVTTVSYDEFRQVYSSFYLHLLRHTRSCSVPVDLSAVARDALDLVEQAFAREGGLAGAMAEARDGTRGGCRFLLDVMTEFFKRDQQAKEISRVLKEAIDPLDWAGKVAFMSELLHRLGPDLPPDLRAQPAERYAKYVESFVQQYVKSINEIGRLMRAM
jgi:hypothetical protein